MEAKNTGELKPRALLPHEIQCRIGQLSSWRDKDNNQRHVTLMLYKDARVDIRILTELFGTKWKREHQVKDGVTYCTVSVWNDEIGGWVSREDAGATTDIEQEKGTASDSFKRACTNFGIGLELYSAKNIDFPVNDSEIAQNSAGKDYLKSRFFVSQIQTDPETKVIQHITIVDRFNNVRFSR